MAEKERENRLPEKAAADRRPCIRCLIEGLPGEEALAAILRERVEALPEEERAAEPTRLKRLVVCLACGRLNHGTCAECGCYVEIRAARREKGCPIHRW